MVRDGLRDGGHSNMADPRDHRGHCYRDMDWEGMFLRGLWRNKALQ